ncbi:sce7725 family protein [Virgibacillus halotolerans]|uniref:sce7725 family protein n=1 Tax=Virgibacillus halotolerans TaxID=1071053 RepID=UPI001961FD88|nr:sce7725 family protein [Virgibacillus halotolerans]
MYFPYLRGRQFELLALRELAEHNLLSKKVTPIIEPIKPSSTLIKTMGLFIEKNRYFAVIHNPQVGSFNKELASLEANNINENLMKALQDKRIIKSHIINENSHAELDKLLSEGNKRDELLLINNASDYIDTYLTKFSDKKAKYILIPDKSTFKRRIKAKENRISLDDKFKKKARNADYLEVEDEPFSEDHLYYEEDGYLGFSDYSIVGADFFESGFAPYAVAIHIVYLDSEQKLRIKHFVSDTNEDFNDPAGKFYEALKKLMAWKSKTAIDTRGMREFTKHYERGTYPGLGTVKKLSIMHHVELVSKYLDGESNKYDMLQ